jgi:hypothetical protein
MNTLQIDYDAIRISASRERTQAIDEAGQALLVGSLRVVLAAATWLEQRVSRSLRQHGAMA